jgi:hypothetical protein
MQYIGHGTESHIDGGLCIQFAVDHDCYKAWKRRWCNGISLWKEWLKGSEMCKDTVDIGKDRLQRVC